MSKPQRRVQIRLLDKPFFVGKMKIVAYARITIAGIQIRGLMISEKNGNLKVRVPSIKTADGEFTLLGFPDPEIKAQIHRTILDKYRFASKSL